MRTAAMIVAMLAAPLGGCIARTALDVATLPVKAGGKAGGKAINSALPSQSRADRNYGRRMRKEEEREGRERRDWAKRCKATPDAPACQNYAGYRAGQG